MPRRLRFAGSALPFVLAASFAAPPALAAREADVQRDVRYGAANGKPLLLDAYVPRDGDGDSLRPAVILIHGGGFRGGDKASFEPEARKLAGDNGWVAFSINYRLDEPAAFPAEVDDVRAAVTWVRDNAAEFQVDPERIGALGESAGGHLAAMLAVLGEGDRDRGSRIRAGVAWSGPMDLTALARSRGDGWGAPLMGCPLSSCPDRFAQASPITHVDGSDAPLFLVNSTDELVPRAQADEMARRIEDEGAVTQLRILPGARHALDYREDVWPATELFLRKHLVPQKQTSMGTPVFFATVLVVVGVGAALVLTRRRSGRA